LPTDGREWEIQILLPYKCPINILWGSGDEKTLALTGVKRQDGREGGRESRNAPGTQNNACLLVRRQGLPGDV
jgi:hypothetical protein